MTFESHSGGAPVTATASESGFMPGLTLRVILRTVRGLGLGVNLPGPGRSLDFKSQVPGPGPAPGPGR